ncbi:MAG: tRNA 2-thiocytidine(32) synthetase TtcA [Proteobacteria bacterium]|nr:tRNA 2-thiocytidine(32) synthetase TtcA [Pseudomonadota bacterium]
MAENKKTKLFLHLKKWLENTILKYNMVEEGDRVLVAVSGGVDSMVLLDLFSSPMLFVPPEFSLLAVNIDLGFDNDNGNHSLLRRHFEENGYEYIMEKTDIGHLAHSDYNRKNPCFLCSRLRRKRIFEIADKTGCNKIAFAHHKDDIIETLLINIFYAREISTMTPNQSIFGGELHIIRPLAYIRENLIKKYAKECRLPAIENNCPTSKVSRRLYIKKLLNDLEGENKDIRENIFKAMGNVKMDYLL